VIGSHVTPKFYLEQFAIKAMPKAKTGKLWAYSVDAPTRHGTAKGEGVENGYFGMPTEGGRLNEVLEYQLASLENRANDVLVMAPHETFVWSNGYRKIMADYVGLLYARTKTRRNATAWISGRVSQDLLRLVNDEHFMSELADEYSKVFNERVDVSILTNSLKAAAHEVVTPDDQRKFFLSELLYIAKWLSEEILLRRPWQVWKAPEGEQFITSDNPVVTMFPIDGDFAPGFGFNARGVLIACPLNWRSCLVIGVADNKSFKEVNTETLDRVNEIQVRCMFQKVYSHDRSSQVETAVREYGATTKFGENAFIVTGDFLPKLKEFMRNYARQKASKKSSEG